MATEAAPARAVGPTRLAYFDDMWALRSSATVLYLHQEEGGRRAVVLDATVFHPQGGGQPADTGVISAGGARFLVEDVRMKHGVGIYWTSVCRMLAYLIWNLGKDTIFLMELLLSIKELFHRINCRISKMNWKKK